jgi:lysozyme
MKRGILIIALFTGAAVAAGYFIITGQSSSLGELASLVISYFRRAGAWIMSETDKVTGSASIAFDQAVTLIAGFEGFSGKAYPDADGFSIGYGHFITPDDPYDANSMISESDAWALLASDAQQAYQCVTSSVSVPLSDNQIAALTSLCYNIGCGAFRDSTLLRKLNANDYAGAAAQFPAWNKSQGEVNLVLVSRRNSEMGVFNS